MFKKLMLLLFVVQVFYLFSCSPKNNPAQPELSSSLTFTPTLTLTSTQVLTPALTATPTPTATAEQGDADTTAPSTTVRLMWIHHSTGSDWVSSSHGGLGTALNNNNYYVTEADYGWTVSNVEAGCSSDLGNYTDTFDWPCWFNETSMPEVYANSSHYDYTNVIPDPGGENEVIMFKSCYPNSEVGSDIADEQAMYNGLLGYFADHTDKLFILIIPPPEIDISSAVLTRELSNWLADRETGWLSDYAHDNVYAFDYYNVLTHPDNHHRINSGSEEHIVANSSNELYYPKTAGDSHPSDEGHQKATDEFVPLLNSWYNKWKAE
ncbi:MAG: hypothetical protein ACLFP1_04365 [Candidatus Goldiibacteriota bacterium]